MTVQRHLVKKQHRKRRQKQKVQVESCDKGCAKVRKLERCLGDNNERKENPHRKEGKTRKKAAEEAPLVAAHGGRSTLQITWTNIVTDRKDKGDNSEGSGQNTSTQSRQKRWEGGQKAPWELLSEDERNKKTEGQEVREHNLFVSNGKKLKKPAASNYFAGRTLGERTLTADPPQSSELRGQENYGGCGVEGAAGYSTRAGTGSREDTGKCEAGGKAPKAVIIRKDLKRRNHITEIQLVQKEEDAEPSTRAGQE
ncbi:hypothetical protein Baya_0239 [Bagarius yarrelli]|uniref:Uncharacterized protein n=1 Tax=Bagarius yarrelli TaxID=175774 RepID=A0A556THP1_BAGYA|nr:hypothetical protein Baya_0239 [Bagarius yarrelli]